MYLEKFAKEIEKCVLCGACHSVCPVYAEELNEAHVARGRMALLNALLAGDIGLKEDLKDILATCIGCKACTAHCPSGAAGDLANLAAKVTFGQEIGLPFYQRILSNQVFSKPGQRSKAASLLDMMGRRVYHPLAGIRLTHPLLPYIRDGKARTLPSPGRPPLDLRLHKSLTESPSQGRVALFLGCAIEQFFPNWGESAIRILNGAGFDVVSSEGWACCGAPLLSMGDLQTAKQMMRTNIAFFSEQKPDAVITLCATCGDSLRNLYPRFLGTEEAAPLSPKVMDLQEFLVTRGLFQELELAESQGSNLRVTYHAPCHLNHGMGVDEDPIKIMQHLPGIDFVEMEDADRCCGGGGLFSLTHYDLSLKIGKHKVDRIQETGAKIVATACPSCALHLTDLLARAGLDVQVAHVCDLVSQSMRGQAFHEIKATP